MPDLAYSTLAEEVHVYIGMCPAPLVVRAIRDSAIAFCEESLCYTYRDVTTLGDNSNEHTFTVPAETTFLKVEAIRKVENGSLGREIDPTSEALLDQENAWSQPAGNPTKFYMLEVGKIAFSPAAQSGFQFAHTIVVKPKRTSTGLREDLVERYGDYLISGAVARLASMKGAEWSDPQTAAEHSVAFQAGVSKARRECNGDNLNKKRVVSYGGI